MKILSIIATLSLLGQFAFASKVGEAAPQFKSVDAYNKTISLNDFKGQWVVLEWYNKDCPYVKKHYGSKNMQKLQKKFTDKKVVWLTVLSSAKDKQGYLDAKEAQAHIKDSGLNATHLILDSSGEVGKLYKAKTTPHMYVVNPEQKLVYAGAIDDNSSSDPKVIPTSKNYIDLALSAGLENKTIETASTPPYGCSVKY
jgi:peroxiredoxin